MKRLVFAALIAAAVIALPARRARADASTIDKADCELVEIGASISKDPVLDPDLKPLEKKLKKAPFKSWNVFHQLSRSSHTLVRFKPETVKLKLGSATVLLRELSGSKGVRVALTLTIDDASGKRVLDTKISVDAGDYLVVGRSLPNDDGHLLALTCR